MASLLKPVREHEQTSRFRLYNLDEQRRSVMQRPTEWPYWAEVAQDVLAVVLAVMAIMFLPVLSTRATKYMNAKGREHQRIMLHRIAEEAAALAEAAYPGGGGPQKLALAMRYAQEQAEKSGIQAGTDAIRASIEKAVMDYNAMVKPWAGIPASAVLRPPYGEGVSQ
ncbi:Bacteriophage holin of superfamily 6 (Holin_LLH) [Paenibacillaceae bacterium GAS479]|nr:Bacteriophage holin of superfamily 6 (Holin_LLH) [Paenibacillaceae bacterium GAS479]